MLDKNGLTLPVSGQDASPVGLQNILLGKQTATVYKPFKLEADAAIDLAQKLMAGTPPTVDKKDTFGVPFIAETPVVVDAKNMKVVFDDGNAKVSDVCTGDVAAKCTAAGVADLSTFRKTGGGRGPARRAHGHHLCIRSGSMDIADEAARRRRR